MSHGTRLPNAGPKLMFDHVDQSFLQIVCDLYRSTYIQNTRNFSQNLLRDIASERAMIFGPPPPRSRRQNGWSRPDAALNQTTL
jgi:hypothetical protein